MLRKEVITEDQSTQVQRDLARSLGLDVSGDSAGVAAARLYDAVGPAVEPGYEVLGATTKQIAFARSLGLDVSRESAGVAGARISDALIKRSRELLARLDISAGDRVRRTLGSGFSREYTVSSIGKNGRIYFKGGNGAGAWPSQVEKLAPAGDE